MEIFSPSEEYDCHKCFNLLREKYALEKKVVAPRFIVCPTCGNKRCPKATDHELACTGSNEPGQKGSVYE